METNLNIGIGYLVNEIGRLSNEIAIAQKDTAEAKESKSFWIDEYLKKEKELKALKEIHPEIVAS